jgi:hypothetical protein
VGSGSTTLVKCDCLKCGEVHPSPLLLQLLLYLGQEQFAAVKQKLFYRNVRADLTNLATVGTNFLQALPRPLQLRQLSLQLKKRCFKIYSRGKRAF